MLTLEQHMPVLKVVFSFVLCGVQVSCSSTLRLPSNAASSSTDSPEDKCSSCRIQLTVLPK